MQPISGIKIPINICDSEVQTQADISKLNTQNINNKCEENKTAKPKNSINLESSSSINETKKTESKSNTKSSKNFGNTLPLTTKGSFLQDSFFNNCRENFLSSVSEALNESEKVSGKSANEKLNSYRQMRQSSSQNKKHVSSVTEDQSSYKVSS